MINNNFAYKYVCSEIIKDFKEKKLSASDKLPTEKELCQKYDVSFTTIRRAVEQLLQDKILIRGMGKGLYLNPIVRSFDLPKNRYVGVLRITIDDMLSQVDTSKYKYTNLYAQKIYSQLYKEIGDNYAVLIDSIEKSRVKEDFAGSILNRADVILILGEAEKEMVDYISSFGKFVIVYNYFDNDIRAVRINNDDRLKYRQLTEYYIEHGFKRFAFINGINLQSDSLERYMGFQDALVMHNLTLEKELLRWGNSTPECGYALMNEILDSGVKHPEVVICLNDGVCMGVYDAIEEHGLTVGKDVLIAGHDNSELPNEKYKFTTIDPDYKAVGKKIAEIMRKSIWIDEQFIVPGKIIIR